MSGIPQFVVDLLNAILPDFVVQKIPFLTIHAGEVMDLAVSIGV